MSAIYEALLFLVSTIFDLYIFVLVIRVLLAYAGASYYDPITQFIVRCTDMLVKPVRRFIPNVRGIEVSTLVIIFALEIIKYTLITVLTGGKFGLLGLSIIALADTLKMILQTLFYTIILQALLSFVQPNSPFSVTLYKINAPILRPIQRLCPTVGGMDISPIPAMLLLQLTIILLVNPLMALGVGVLLA